LRVSVVNARHVKQVPGRKTDVKDSQWLARLARYGLVKLDDQVFKFDRTNLFCDKELC